MKRFKGVATKYLSNYLHWFEFIDSIGKDKIQKAAERDLLLRACSVKAVQKINNIFKMSLNFLF